MKGGELAGRVDRVMNEFVQFLVVPVIPDRLLVYTGAISKIGGGGLMFLGCLS